MGQFRIEICGGIAAGKTMLAERISHAMGASIIREQFERIPFWKECYESGGKIFSLEKDIAFLLDRNWQIVRGQPNSDLSICDFTYFQDLAYSDITRDADLIGTVEHLFERLKQHIAPPNVIIDLRCTTALQQQRIRDRGRHPESGISGTFLVDLREALDNRLGQCAANSDIAVIEALSDEANFLFNNDSLARLVSELNVVIGPSTRARCE